MELASFSYIEGHDIQAANPEIIGIMEGGEMKRVAFFAGEEQLRKLKALSLATRIKASDYIREGIDMVLVKYARVLKKAQKKGGE